MGGPPAANPLHRRRAGVVGLVPGFGRPAALGRGLGGLPARLRAAMALTVPRAGVRVEEPVTMKAFAAALFTHKPPSYPLRRPAPNTKKPGRKTGGKKSQREEEEEFLQKGGRRSTPRRKRRFNPAFSRHFHPGADKCSREERGGTLNVTCHILHRQNSNKDSCEPSCFGSQRRR